MTRERLLCCYCGEPIRRQPRDPDDGYTQHTDVATGIERAWHMRCSPASGTTHFQHALRSAKTAIAMGMALPAEEWEAFRSIVGKALDVQRQAEFEHLRAERHRLERLLAAACCALEPETPARAIWALALVCGFNLERPAHLDEGPFVDRDGFAWAETEDGRFARIALVDDA